MNFVCALLLAAVPAQDKYGKAVERMLFPEESVLTELAGRSEVHQRLVLLLADPGIWARMFRVIDEKLGLFTEKCDIQVLIEENDEPQPARGTGKGGRGAVKFNLNRLVEYQKKVDEYQREKAAGKIVRWIIPPVKLEVIIVHEMAHVFCGTYEEKWLTEGAACYVGDDTSVLYAFNNRGARVEGLDQAVPDEDSYARGMAFFRWMEATCGGEKLRDFLKRLSQKGEKYREAAEAVTGLSWDRIVADEKTWSAAWLEKFKPEKEK